MYHQNGKFVDDGPSYRPVEYDPTNNELHGSRVGSTLMELQQTEETDRRPAELG